ncbi:unnamed protein product (macronuclear) [Paramecium tetraurelia]|uniref:Uncharacterized protein n=1 Tax=Paramecium tetraurelia TaxID=5888 RepID=A0BQV3_PARTE|nr:uncharacterized protein GSPATT00031149001 [Paramecium tetraurelia]CAK60920.1 unnamed protein product [Paramecium tetraurelia]|eukprot:XP_001428318.1 hypothetical protein (macronuclear) [Paramecium tetraurelia strain d4-2]
MNNNKFQSQQWQILYAKHKQTVDNIEHRNYKFPNEVELQLQRQRDANRKVKNSQYFKQKQILSRIIESNLILSKKLYEIEHRKQAKFMQINTQIYCEAPVRWSTKSLREENYNKIKVQNQKQFKRITHVKGTLQTQ